MVKRLYFRIVWDLEVVSDFKEILTWLQNQNSQAPKLVKKAVFERINLLKTNPFLFEQDRLKRPPDETFRAFSIYNYRVTYQIVPEKKEVRILRIRHSGREPLEY